MFDSDYQPSAVPKPKKPKPKTRTCEFCSGDTWTRCTTCDKFVCNICTLRDDKRRCPTCVAASLGVIR